MHFQKSKALFNGFFYKCSYQLLSSNVDLLACS